MNAPPAPAVAHPATLPVLPLKNSLLLPYIHTPISVGRPASVAAVEAAMASEDKTLVVVAQRDASVDQPQPADLYAIACKAVIKRMARGEGGLQLLLQGVERVRLESFPQVAPYLRAEVVTVPLPTDRGTEVDALRRELLAMAARMQELAKTEAPIDFLSALEQIEDPMHLAFLLASLTGQTVEKEQALLEAETCLAALRLMHANLTYELQVLEIRQKIATQAETEISKEQREYHLRQQLRAIREELGEGEEGKAGIADLRKRLAEATLPEGVHKEAERELSRLEGMNSASPDYQLTRTWLELVAELPWMRLTEDSLDLGRARQVLDEDHFDLKEVKERILEHLAVLKLNPDAKSPILCFAGPPGVGKTSLGKSIARSLGRKFERLSLGGLHDESELRGHRRTYIGAMPGRIIQAIRRAGARNPVLMLDEVDKLGRDFRGDPAAALLEILDPAQNNDFHDNYLDLPFDLSKVFFITTANTLDTIPAPLLDRMETLRLSGYSEEEKVEIARRYLVDRQRHDAGLKEGQLTLPDETLSAIIRRYTREAGVRQFERALGRVARRISLRFAEGKTEPVTVAPDALVELLGPEKVALERARQELPPGVATGLAWTEAGGDVLYVEAILFDRPGELMLTGQLGEVMQESAKAALSYVRSHAKGLGIKKPEGRVHLHVPAGAVPKDGPSAGVTMAVALASLYTARPVRNDTAMTGEISLTGLVLPVGGIKEKVLAARRIGIRRVILPKDNEKDLAELPENVRKELEFIFAARIEDALAAALTAPAKSRTTNHRPAGNRAPRRAAVRVRRPR
ncbi:MAG: endopeptidase La [Deltaproteobacteria bacterium]